MKLPSFKDYLRTNNKYIYKNPYTGNYEFNKNSFRLNLASKKYENHLEKASDFGTFAKNEDFRLLNNLSRKRI